MNSFQRFRHSGMFWMILGAAAFALMTAFLKNVSADCTSFQAVFVRSAVGTAIMLVLSARGGIPVLGSRSKLLWVRGGLGFLSLTLFIYAIFHIPLGTAVVLNSTAPLFVVLLAPLLLGEAVSRRVYWLFPFFLAGVALIFKPEFSVATLALLAGLGSGILAAGSNLAVRKLGETDSEVTIVLYFSAISMIGAASFMWIDWQPLSARTLLYLGCAGLLAAASQLSLTRAYRLERASVVALYFYAAPVFAFLIDVLVFSEIPDAFGLMGAVMILTCGAIAAQTTRPAVARPSV